MAAISQDAIDLIVSCEVSSKAYYEKKLRAPTWPGGASGITIGIGYDVGYVTAAQLRRDWAQRIPESMIDALSLCCGMTGESARTFLSALWDMVDVPWQAANDVFVNVSLPAYVQATCDAIPGAEFLNPDSLGALASITYNRGASYTKVRGPSDTADRYREMRNIRAYVIAGRLSLIPDEIRAMKRLWEGKGLPGLLARRDREADLFARGLKASAPAMERPAVNEAPPPVVPAPKPAAPEAGAVAGPVIAAGEAARQAAESGLNIGRIIAIAAIGIAVSIGAYVVTRLYRSRAVLANQKG